MAFISVTYTFSNGATADATQVNQDFTDIINGTSDGTKNFNFSALTCTSATINGAVTLGQSSSNALTVNASLATNFPVQTNTTYDFGSSSLGLKSVYLGGGGAFTTRLLSATLGSSWTITLPTSGGTANYFLMTDGTGVTSWSSIGIPALAKSSSYGLAASDSAVLFTTSSSALTATLPTSVGASGKKYTIKKVDSGTGTVALATTSAQTIDGLASGVIILGTLNDSITVISDGANWLITDEKVFVGARASGATTSISNSAATKVINGTATFNPQGDYSVSTGLYTVSRPGKYRVTGFIKYASASWTANEIVELYIYQNGSQYDFLGRIFPPTITNSIAIWGTDIVQCAASDTLGVYALHQQGGSVALDGNCYIDVERIGN